MAPHFAFDHVPYSLAVVVPFLVVAAWYAVREWRRDRGADEKARQAHRRRAE